jgi:hypothetical protein
MAKSHARALQSAFAKLNEKLTKLESSPGPRASDKLDRFGESSREAQMARDDEQLDALIELTSALNVFGSTVVAPVLKIIENQDIEQNVAECAFRPDVIEREVRIGALIDRQNERGLAQLVHLKEYKRLYRKKQVTGPPDNVIIVPSVKAEGDI